MKTRRSKAAEVKDLNEEKPEEVINERTSPLKKRRGRIKSITENVLTQENTSNTDDHDVNKLNNINADNATFESIEEIVKSPINNSIVTIQDTIAISLSEDNDGNFSLETTEINQIQSNEDFCSISLETDNEKSQEMECDKNTSQDSVKGLNPIEEIVPGEEDFQPNFEGDEDFEGEGDYNKSSIVNEEVITLESGNFSNLETLATSIDIDKELNLEWDAKPLEEVLSGSGINNDLLKVSKSASTIYHLQTDETGPKNVSNIIHIFNLVRPFTLRQLKEECKKYGEFDDENGFWIDKIKSHCIVKYDDEDSAAKALHELNGQKWPASNPKILKVEFTDQKTLDFHKGIDASLTQQSEFRKNSTTSSSINAPEPRFLPEFNSHSNVSLTSMDPQDFKMQKNLAPFLPTPEGPTKFTSTPSRRIVIKRDEEKLGGGDKFDGIDALDGDKRTGEPLTPGAKLENQPARRSFDTPIDASLIAEGVGQTDVKVSDITEGGDISIGHHNGPKEWDKDKIGENLAGGHQPPHGTKGDGAANKSGQLMDELFNKTHILPCIYWLPLTLEEMELKVKKQGVAYVYEKDIIRLSQHSRTYQAFPYDNIGRPKLIAPANDQSWSQPHNAVDNHHARQDPAASYNAPYQDTWPQPDGHVMHQRPPPPYRGTANYEPRNFLSRDVDYPRRGRRAPYRDGPAPHDTGARNDFAEGPEQGFPQYVDGRGGRRGDKRQWNSHDWPEGQKGAGTKYDRAPFIYEEVAFPPPATAGRGGDKAPSKRGPDEMTDQKPFYPSKGRTTEDRMETNNFGRGTRMSEKDRVRESSRGLKGSTRSYRRKD